MKKFVKVILAIILFIALAHQGAFADPSTLTTSDSQKSIPAQRKFSVVFRTIKAIGPIEQLQSQIGSNTELVKSLDGKTGYLVRKANVENQEQLIQLMGAKSETELADGQKGLLNVYRYANNELISNFLKLLPVPTGTVQLELTDTTGFEDTSKYPTVQSDFWPRNAKTNWTLDGKISQVDIDIQMSPVNCSTSGKEATHEMESTFVHEFAHSFDLASSEPDGYGPDGTHYINETIKEKAAFLESFADFHQLLFDPTLIPTYRWNLRNIKYENASGYQELNPKNPEVSGTDLTNVEGVQALILYRLSQDIPDGRNKIYNAFKVVNDSNKTFRKFLCEFVKENPDKTELIATILDQETRRKLSNDQMEGFLGASQAAEDYINKRHERFTLPVATNVADSHDPSYDPYASAAPKDLKALPKDLKKPLLLLESIKETITKSMVTIKQKVKTRKTGSNPFSDD
ncbi:MAG: hypothetical protein HQM08_04790 [Candidatus Riflebacteria bacterium]|nr:hypothetical protein [Candidatus Riflebacteria bacterium]